MNIKFSKEVFDWVVGECGEVSPAAFIVKLVEKYKNSSQEGADINGTKGHCSREFE